MWIIAGTLWKSFLNLVLQNENKNLASDNNVSGKRLVVILRIQLTLHIHRPLEIVNGCKQIKVFFSPALSLLKRFCSVRGHFGSFR